MNRREFIQASLAAIARLFLRKSEQPDSAVPIRQLNEKIWDFSDGKTGYLSQEQQRQLDVSANYDDLPGETITIKWNGIEWVAEFEDKGPPPPPRWIWSVGDLWTDGTTLGTLAEVIKADA